MDQLIINQNFNGKLFNDSFSYLMPADPEMKPGNRFELIHKGLFLGIVEAKALRMVLYCRLSEVLSYLYCGRDLRYLSVFLSRQFNQGKIFESDDVFMHVILQYEERDIENQNTLLEAWWEEKKSDYYTLKK